tara:strand:+ start:179 stop:340 length:162 start_codon:yes stop_codon:yes gene_type:complete
MGVRTDNKEEVYSVWCGGVEVNYYYCTLEDAKIIKKGLRKDGYDDVHIRKEID